MRVRVKEGKKGFIYGSLRRGDIEERAPDEFTLKTFKHPSKLDADGEPLVVSAEDQFSKAWMENLSEPPEDEIEDLDPSEKNDKVEPKKKRTKKKSAKKD